MKQFIDKNDVAMREIITTRVINAPRELVFDAWAKAENIKHWWGPKGFTNTIHLFEFKPGGFWKFTMHGPDGIDYQNKSEFVEIRQPEQIIFNHHKPMHRFQVTATFEDVSGKTKLTFHMLFETIEECEKVKAFIPAANEENFDKLEQFLNKI